MRGCEFFDRKAGLALVAALCPLAGCGAMPSPRGWKHNATHTSPPLTAEELRERADRTFRRAVFYKPREESLVGIEGTFAPLIVQEWQPDRTGVAGFGANVGKPGQERIDISRPTIYVDVSRTYVGSTELQQLTYLWRYPTTCDPRKCASHGGSGVRITLGLDGLPILWEALSTNEDHQLLFVSTALEQVAQREFGGPLEGRTFAIERAVTESKRAVVVRLLDDASVAMGPYVYVGAGSEPEVNTILCRCMPSQVEAFDDTRYFDFAPMESLGWSLPHPGCGLGYPFESDTRIRWSGGLSSYYLRYQSRSRRLGELLRWPKEYQ